MEVDGQWYILGTILLPRNLLWLHNMRILEALLEELGTPTRQILPLVSQPR